MKNHASFSGFCALFLASQATHVPPPFFPRMAEKRRYRFIFQAIWTFLSKSKEDPTILCWLVRSNHCPLCRSHFSNIKPSHNQRLFSFWGGDFFGQSTCLYRRTILTDCCPSYWSSASSQKSLWHKTQQPNWSMPPPPAASQQQPCSKESEEPARWCRLVGEATYYCPAVACSLMIPEKRFANISRPETEGIRNV